MNDVCNLPQTRKYLCEQSCSHTHPYWKEGWREVGGRDRLVTTAYMYMTCMYHPVQEVDNGQVCVTACAGRNEASR